jgi:hypothetical protein
MVSGVEIQQWSGVRPYYRRTSRHGETTVFLRYEDSGSTLGSITFATREIADDMLPPGRTYTIEQEWRGDR